MVNLRVKHFFMLTALLGVMLFSSNGFGQDQCGTVSDCPDNCYNYQCIANICLPLGGPKPSGTLCGNKLGCSFCDGSGTCVNVRDGVDCSDAGDGCAYCSLGDCKPRHLTPCGPENCYTCLTGTCSSSRPQGPDADCGVVGDACSHCGEGVDAGTCVSEPITTDCGVTDDTCSHCGTGLFAGSCVSEPITTDCGVTDDTCSHCGAGLFAGTCVNEPLATDCGVTDDTCSHCGTGLSAGACVDELTTTDCSSDSSGCAFCGENGNAGTCVDESTTTDCGPEGAICSHCSGSGTCVNEPYNLSFPIDCSSDSSRCAICIDGGICQNSDGYTCGSDGCETCTSGTCSGFLSDGDICAAGGDSNSCRLCNGAGTCVTQPEDSPCEEESGFYGGCHVCNSFGSCTKDLAIGDVCKFRDQVPTKCKICVEGGGGEPPIVCGDAPKDTPCAEGGCQLCNDSGDCILEATDGIDCDPKEGCSVCTSGACTDEPTTTDCSSDSSGCAFCGENGSAGYCIDEPTTTDCSGVGSGCANCTGTGTCEPGPDHVSCTLDPSEDCDGCLQGDCTQEELFGPDCFCISNANCAEGESSDFDYCKFVFGEPYGECDQYNIVPCEVPEDCKPTNPERPCVRYDCVGGFCKFESRDNCCTSTDDSNCQEGNSDCVVGTCDIDSSNAYEENDLVIEGAYNCHREEKDNCCEDGGDCPPNDGECIEVTCSNDNNPTDEYPMCGVTNIPGCCTDDADCPTDDLPCIDWFCNEEKRCEVEEKDGCCNGPEDCPTSTDECVTITCDLNADLYPICVASHNEECCDDVSDGSIANFEGEREYFAKCGCNSCCFPKRDCIDHLSWTVETDLEIDYFLLENIDQDGVVVHSEIIPYPEGIPNPKDEPVDMSFSTEKRRCKKALRKYRISFFDTSGKQHGLTTTIVTNQIQI